MRLRPFLLDRWLDNKFGHSVDCDLASSTGPVWTLNELLADTTETEREALFATAMKYTPANGSTILRESVAALCGVSPEQVQITTGASEALLILFLLEQEPGANVVLPFPSFSSYQAVCEALGFECRFYQLWDGKGFRVNPQEVRGLVDANTRVLVVNSPHNPSGLILSDEQLRELHDLASERGIHYVSDEVYHPIYHGAPGGSAALLPHATVVGSMSKAFSFSGTRIGWLVSRDQQHMQRCFDARAYFTISSSPVSEQLAVLALRRKDAICQRAQSTATQNLAALDAFMTRQQDTFVWPRPSGGLTAFPHFRCGQDSRPFCEQLLTHGVMLVPGDCFGMPEHFRIGFGAEPGIFSEGLARIEEFLEEWKRTSTARCETAS